MDTKREMPSSSLVELLRLLDDAAIQVWLDGGWGVDALLETQTRQHKDVDIILRLADVPKLQEVLGRRGFTFKEGAPPDSNQQKNPGRSDGTNPATPRQQNRANDTNSQLQVLAQELPIFSGKMGLALSGGLAGMLSAATSEGRTR